MTEQWAVYSMWVLVALLVLALIYFTVRRNTQFSILDFICTDGKGDPKKAAYVGAFLIATWVLWFLTKEKLMTEGYFLAYLGAFVAERIASTIVNRSGPTQ